MSKANKVQIGGTHYNKRGDLQHWDLVERNNLGYFIGNITKYLFRWRDKNGVQDLHKASHYLLKYEEINALLAMAPGGLMDASDFPRTFGMSAEDVVDSFDLDFYQGAVIMALFEWQRDRAFEDLNTARLLLDRYIAKIEKEDARLKEQAAGMDQQLRDIEWDARRDRGSNIHPAEGPDVSDGCDCEGFIGGCERMHPGESHAGYLARTGRAGIAHGVPPMGLMVPAGHAAPAAAQAHMGGPTMAGTTGPAAPLAGL